MKANERLKLLVAKRRCQRFGRGSVRMAGPLGQLVERESGEAEAATHLDPRTPSRCSRIPRALPDPFSRRLLSTELRAPPATRWQARYSWLC